MLKIIFFFFFRPNGDFHPLNHASATNDNVSFGKRDFNTPFSFLNDLDRSEIETTTEL